MERCTLSFVLLVLIMDLTAQVCDPLNFEEPVIYDTYHEFYNKPASWAGFNVHDPTVYKDGDWYYMYNTDVGMGYDPGTGALKRRSSDLVNWDFLGKAFDGIPESAREFFLVYNPEYTDNGIWAPFLIKYGDEFRLYYSAPGGLEGQNLAFIGWATSSSADGPWDDQGMITGSVPGDTINAIDPTVVIDRTTNQHWMAYGSYETGVYIFELDSMTGGLKIPGDRGSRIAGRAGGRHRAIEGPEINYRNGWYYLFVSYDWLENYYNVRVGRSLHPYGPYLDINGTDMAEYSDNFPVIEKAYRFNDHEGWQGTGHCSVYNDDGNYYIFNQARPSTDIYNMDLHVRKIFWIDDWPVISPERYAAVPQCGFTSDSLVGNWEYMPLEYKVGVLHSRSSIMELHDNGTIDNDPANTWMLQDSLLTLTWNNGESVDEVIVSQGWDWENSCRALLFTGMNQDGLNVWGKKIDQSAVDAHTKLVSGAAYTIRSHWSNMLIEVPEGADEDGITIRQGKDNGETYQVWRLAQYPDGYWKIAAEHSTAGRVIEVPDGDPGATFLHFGTFTGEDKQKFQIVYMENGYFKIFTKVSDNTKCFDLYNFSIEEGGFISQWTDLNGVNQAWKFHRIDSLGIDNTVNIPDNNHKDVRVYPNPFNEILYLDLTGTAGMQHVVLLNSVGQIVFSDDLRMHSDGIYGLSPIVPDGFYILRVYTSGYTIQLGVVKKAVL